MLPAIKGVFNYIMNNEKALIVSITAIGVAVVLALGPASQAVLALTAIVTALGIVDVEVQKLFASMDEQREEDLHGWEKFLQGLRRELKGAGQFMAATLSGEWSRAWGLFAEFAKFSGHGINSTGSRPRSRPRVI